MKQTKEQLLSRISKMQSHFLDKEVDATDPAIRRYYSGVAEGLRKSYMIVLDELSDAYIEEN